MPDIVDMAQNCEALELRAALSQVVHRPERRDAVPEGPVHCRDCGEEISLQRLEALPWADRCVECQAALEEAWD